ncbi:MAG: hypothetical protein K6C08_05190 [Oscillospiraceae bacterium]|nr:hypothetical protein [Oscillospiraceae bacterium]
MAEKLSAAERELLGIYTRQAYEAYLGENLKECENRAAQIEALNPGDVHARFLRGAIVGRKARPGTEMPEIREAVRIWKPLYEQLTGEGMEAMKNAMCEAFSTILYIPTEQASRQWDVYCDARTAKELKDTISALLELDDSYRKQMDLPYSRWIHSQFTKNWVFLADEIAGINKGLPVGTGAGITAYGETLAELVRMAERIPESGESERAVRTRVLQRLEDFRKLNQV